jgi:hypothetical protein
MERTFLEAFHNIWWSWLNPVILATWEAEVGRIMASPGRNFTRLHLKQWLGMARCARHLNYSGKQSRLAGSLMTDFSIGVFFFFFIIYLFFLCLNFGVSLGPITKPKVVKICLCIFSKDFQFITFKYSIDFFWQY